LLLLLLVLVLVLVLVLAQGVRALNGLMASRYRFSPFYVI
jgi:hypothetical protein